MDTTVLVLQEHISKRHTARAGVIKCVRCGAGFPRQQELQEHQDGNRCGVVVQGRSTVAMVMAEPVDSGKVQLLLGNEDSLRLFESAKTGSNQNTKLPSTVLVTTSSHDLNISNLNILNIAQLQTAVKTQTFGKSSPIFLATNNILDAFVTDSTET